ncbi:hypothetical protein WMY93_004401 [Mugilogobius chulae]|uniref:P2X purinoceptor n=1 Tax=Mugilogobius chulae TaxID=88201 RepID=A0AAW0PNF9_9GOBI
MTKVKGFGIYNDKVMDVADYLTPAQGASFFCIITKVITTENQVQGTCPESESKFSCSHGDSICKKGKMATNGIMTGNCVLQKDGKKACEIQGWCPGEVDTIKTTPMPEVENFTIFIKNSIRFPAFNYAKFRQYPSNDDTTYIKTCNYDMVNNTYCPIFRVGDVVRYAQQNFTMLAHKGGVIGIKIDWTCDLDKSDDKCNPEYSFTRLDTMLPGYNFRFAKYYKMDNGTDYRTLVKAYAIRFDVLVFGKAGKFDMTLTLIIIVVALTAVRVATVLCDIILLNFLKGAEQYKTKKFEEVITPPSHSNHTPTSPEAFISQLTLVSQFDHLPHLSSTLHSRPTRTPLFYNILSWQIAETV